MTVRDVILWPDERLSTPCSAIVQISDETEHLAEDMLETMYAAPGRGLAAPQVGVMQRLFVMDATWKEGVYRPMIFVNPMILETEGAEVTQSEGCLSIPGISVDVSRPERVRMQWTDLNGEMHEDVFDGFAAACVQHEMDHLDGVVTLDRIEEESRARVLSTYQGHPV